jgi:hypothetical protein
MSSNNTSQLILEITDSVVEKERLYKLKELFTRNHFAVMNSALWAHIPI